MLSATSPGAAPRGVRGFMSGAYSLTPGPLPLVNSTPAFSSAFRIAAKVSGQPTSQSCRRCCHANKCAKLGCLRIGAADAHSRLGAEAI